MNSSNTPHGEDIEVPETVFPVIPVYLVQETDTFIAEDIKGALKATGPCRVISVRKAEEIAPALAQEGDVAAALLELSYRDVLQTGLADLLARHGTRIILTYGMLDDPDARAAGCGMLRRPFTEAMIHAELAPQGISVATPYDWELCST